MGSAWSLSQLGVGIVFVPASIATVVWQGWVIWTEMYPAKAKEIRARSISGPGSPRASSPRSRDNPSAENSSKNSTVSSKQSSRGRIKSESQREDYDLDAFDMDRLKWHSVAFGASISAVILLLLYTLLSLLVLFYRWKEDTNVNLAMSCNLLIKALVTGYQFTKSLIYITFVFRLHLGFRNSIYQYSKKFYYTIGSMIAFYLLFSIPIAIVGAHGVIDPDEGICQDSVDTFLVAWMVLCDMFFMIWCLLLFIIPLRKLAQQVLEMQVSDIMLDSVATGSAANAAAAAGANKRPVMTEKEKKKAEKKLRKEAAGMKEILNLIRKYTALTIVTVLSTLLHMIVIAVYWSGPLGYVDMSINVFCLICMKSRYTNMYNRICCGMDNCLKKCCRCCRCCCG